MGLSESVTLKEIANEAREKAMHEQMEQMEKQIETLTIILHELRNEQRGIHVRGMRSDEITPRLVNRRSHDEVTASM